MKRLLTCTMCVIFAFLLVACSDGEALNWSTVVLGSNLPVPSLSNGDIHSNNADNLWMDLCDAETEDFRAYVEACEAFGYTIDAEKEDNSFNAYNSDGYHLELRYTDYNNRISIDLDAPIVMEENAWPINMISAYIPQPASAYGKLERESSDDFLYYAGNMTEEDFDAYAELLVQAGFSEDYYKGDGRFYGTNAAGVHVDLTFKGFNTVQILAKAPKEESTTPTETTEPTEEQKTDDPTEPEETEPKEETGELRTEFKEAMDAYEAFYAEYVDFMKRFNASGGTDLSLLTQYTDYLTRMSEMTDAFNKWDNGEMNMAELAYYAEVQSRVTKMLLEISN